MEHKRYLAFCAYLSLATYGFCLTIVGPALGPIKTFFDITGSQAGLLFSFQSMGLLSTVLLGGLIADHYGIKAVSFLGQTLLCIGLILFSFTRVFPLGILAFFLMGIAGGLIGIWTNTTISSLYNETRTSALNLLHAFFGLGALAGPFFSGYMISTGISWQYIFLSGCGLCFMSLLFFMFSRLPAIDRREKIPVSSLFKIMGNRYTLLLGIATACYVGAEMGVNSWVVLYLEEQLAIKKIVASSFLSYFWLALAFGRILCFSLSKQINEKSLLMLLAFSAMCFYAIFFRSTTATISGIALTLTGLALSGVFPTLLALGTNHFSHALGSITSIVYAFSAVGFLIFPFLIGSAADAYSLQIAMSIPLVLGILLTSVSWLLIKYS